jgi:hypothetical protein
MEKIMADKKMMFCMHCGYSQLYAPVQLLCIRCDGPLVKAPQEHVKDFKYLGEYSRAEARRRDDAENEKLERHTNN